MRKCGVFLQGCFQTQEWLPHQLIGLLQGFRRLLLIIGQEIVSRDSSCDFIGLTKITFNIFLVSSYGYELIR